MKRITIYSNCQGMIIAKLLESELSLLEWDIVAIYNNSVSGKVLKESEVDMLLASSDVIIYQPLGSNNLFDECRINSYPKPLKISFPYIYNSGYQSLVEKSTGRFFEEEKFYSFMFSKGIEESLRALSDGSFPFSIKERFKSSLDELVNREKNCTISVSEFIVNNMDNIPLFISKNHPTYPVYENVTKQILDILQPRSILNKKALTFGALKPDFYAVTPYDCLELGYNYGYSNDWFECNKRALINIFNKKCEPSKTTIFDFSENSITTITCIISRMLYSPFSSSLDDYDNLISHIGRRDTDEDEYYYLLAIYYFIKNDIKNSCYYNDIYLSRSPSCCSGNFLSYILTREERYKEKAINQLNSRHDIQFERVIIDYFGFERFDAMQILPFLAVLFRFNAELPKVFSRKMIFLKVEGIVFNSFFQEVKDYLTIDDIQELQALANKLGVEYNM
ncbi:TPA: hypothetical protein NJ811_001665 [Vibrio parahaemolyticus]|uniref:WcbI family polysaccharide biosynthesis putative acetyltransferase n=1 Tax=Vibrio parahaemolyticus TaxID=670 RepID=UPI00226A3E51|nr:WcbI family polysaccharide biosynthesis putative acetyltransferase [Vibrio parahaemolyticus]MCX8925359.1 WcbI family polysaccharide biosynthesis putative acetyltransferase [Vibrio parahaemolyticus]HCG8183298.1 hypothetical protein [Vibrio parahaemolyticus]HCG9431066.1 hypothetical protein [Vibrio parahaemolyticus]HCG9628190.1 hypothetical protein [Vibrio parahaemolyticus]HCH3555655.1 hypothetical protein [Vibrio parahaemolyticus]